MPKKTKKTKMTRQDAEGLVGLARAASQYFRHPDVEAALGYQQSGHAVIILQEIAEYLRDHVISGEGEGVGAMDRQLMARSLDELSGLLARPEVAKIPFALSSAAMSDRLRDAARRLRR